MGEGTLASLEQDQNQLGVHTVVLSNKDFAPPGLQGIQCISLSIHGPDTGGFCPSAMVQLMWANGVP